MDSLEFKQLLKKISHDLKTPVATLKMLLPDLIHISSDSMEILQGSINRFEEIINEINSIKLHSNCDSFDLILFSEKDSSYEKIWNKNAKVHGKKILILNNFSDFNHSYSKNIEIYIEQGISTQSISSLDFAKTLAYGGHTNIFLISDDNHALDEQSTFPIVKIPPW